MKKLTVLVISGAATLGIGAIAVLGNSLLASQVMTSNIGTTHTSETTSENASSSSKAENESTASDVIFESSRSVSSDAASSGVESEETKYFKVKSSGTDIIISYDNNGKIVAKKKGTPTIAIKGEPGKNDITKEKAVEIATNELLHKCSLKQDVLNQYTSSALFDVTDPKSTVWRVNFSPKEKDHSELTYYYIAIDSKTGDVVDLVSTGGEVG